MVKAWGPVIVGVAAILLSSIFNFFQFRQSRLQLSLERDKARDSASHQTDQLNLEREKTKNLRANLAQQMKLDQSRQELADIETKLNSFYGPFKELRSQSQLLYRYFAQTEKKEARKRGGDFRTLTWLAKGESFNDADRQLLDAILSISDSLLELIEKHTGVVDKPALQDLLGKYAAHIRLLKLAKDGKLTALGDTLSEIVYPRAIDGAIESAVLRLQDRQRELLTLAPADKLEPPKVSPSIEYYNRNANDYTAATAFLDLKALYKEFLANLPAGARILDAGCGPGRDTRAFIERGYRVVSFDASVEMVRRCRDYPHAYCVQMDLRDLSYKEEFDGVWVCAVLLHLTEDEARRAVERLVTALKPGGYLFLSVKQGEGSSTEPDGRFFQYYDEGKLRGLLAQDLRLDPNPIIWSSKGLRVTAADETWINAIIRRVLNQSD